MKHARFPSARQRLHYVLGGASAWPDDIAPHRGAHFHAALTQKHCADGGIGRRAGFRFQWSNPWGFESPPAHHQQHRLAVQRIAPAAADLDRPTTTTWTVSSNPRSMTTGWPSANYGLDASARVGCGTSSRSSPDSAAGRHRNSMRSARSQTPPQLLFTSNESSCPK